MSEQIGNPGTGGTFNIFGGGSLDLGSAPLPDPFAAQESTPQSSESLSQPETPQAPPAAAENVIPQAPAAPVQQVAPVQAVPAQQTAPAQAAPVQPSVPAQQTAPVQSAPPAPADGAQDNGEPENLLSAAVAQAEEKQAAVTADALFSKPPVFEYAAATEEIADTSITFEQLRIEKAADFPELDDGKRVSWTMEYCTIVKQVPTPSKTVIGKLKKEIENSKAFLDALKKAKDKNPVCKVKPKITAQSKGIAGYKGIFPTMEEADASDRHIRILPARDGHVYEMRCTEAGKFIARAGNVKELSEINAGFVPAFPPVPFSLFAQILAFFYHYTRTAHAEVMVYVYWDKEQREYLVRVPMQTVGQAHISIVIPPDETISEDRYVHVADIHSHNSMPAFFSKTDDRDELATRVYIVVGRLHDCPEISARISVGGRFVPIDARCALDLPISFTMNDSEYDKRVDSFLPHIIKQTLRLPLDWQDAAFPEEWKTVVNVLDNGKSIFPMKPEHSDLRRFRFWRIWSKRNGA